MHLKPAEFVIYRFGGVRKTARALGFKYPDYISRWRRPKAKGGRGGEVPKGTMQIILEAADKLKVDITPRDLIYGRFVQGYKPAAPK